MFGILDYICWILGLIFTIFWIFLFFKGKKNATLFQGLDEKEYPLKDISDCRHSAPRNYVSRSLFLVSAKVFCLNKHIPTGFMPFVIPIPSYILQASLNSCTQK